MSAFPVLGIDIGGTKIAVCLADSAGTILGGERILGGGKTTYAETLPHMAALARKLVADAGLTMADVRALGVSTPGPVDLENGVILRSPNMPWKNVALRDDLARELQMPVYFDNDANAGMLAEWEFGAAKGAKNALYVTLSTGIGGGVIAEGRILHGVNGNAGEIGHVVLDRNGPQCGCGLRGCWEAFCGGRQVMERMQAQFGGQPDHPVMRLPEVNGDPAKLGFPALIPAAKAGIPEAVAMWDEICLRTAHGLGIMQMVYNPEVIVLGTVALHAGDFLLTPVQNYLPRFAWAESSRPCRITTSALGLRIGELAGPAVALNGLKSAPGKTAGCTK